MNPKYKPNLLATAVMLAFSAPGAFAQVTQGAESAAYEVAQGNDAVELDTSVVTAAGTAVDLRDAPASISVVTREDIERKPMASIAEILGTLTGVTGGYSPTGAGSKIAFRGMPDKYTLILVDGKRIGSSQLLGHRPDTIPQDLDWLSPESIERIEVVRGAMSSLYGSEAMGGVINIITRKVSPQWGGSITSNYSRPQPSDSGDTSQIGLNVSGPITDGLGLRLGGSFTDRESDSADNGSTGSLSKNVNGKLNWQLNENHSFSIDASAGEERARSFDNLAEREASPDATTETFGSSKMVTRSFGIGHEGRFGEVGTKLDLYVNTFENKGDPAESANAGAKSKESVADFKFDVPFELGVNHWLTAGLQYKEEEVENPGNIGNLAVTWPGVGTVPTEKNPEGWAWAVFAEDQIFLRDDLTLTLGLRTDRTDSFSAHTSPRAYLVYHPADDWTVKGGVSKGFRAPNLKERSLTSGTSSMGMGCTSLAPLGYTGGGCVMVGNPDLEPEISTNYEIGVAFDDTEYSFEATYFTSKIKDMMQNGLFGDGPINGTWYTQQYNIEEAKTSGVELAFGLPITPSISFSGNATYMIESENTTTGEALLWSPEWTANALLEWQVNNQLSTYLSAQYLGKQMYSSVEAESRFAEANTTFDLGANYAVNKNLTLRAGVQNLFNDAVETEDDYGDGDPRTFYVGFTSRF